MIPPDKVAAIHDAAQIESVVGEYVNLKKRGSNLLGLCPFHNEKTPSFSVSPTKGIFKCFGCGKAGNSTKFIMEHEQLSYPEALRYLANKYNIEIEEINTDEARAEKLFFDSLHIINEFAQQHYTNNLLNTPDGQNIGLSYFKERGFRNDTIEKFQLGYSMNSFDDFLKAAKAKGFKQEYLLKLGLVSQKNERIYDFLRGRVMFPIHSISGKVIAFAGRTLLSDKKVPKYVNSPESEVYNKSKELYGLFFAKKSIRDNDNCFLVEGYTDVISLHQAGIENVVASSGTSLTTDQIRRIKRFTSNITILYDGDAAGQQAALRGTDLIIEADMNVKVVILTEGDDPDSFIQKSGQSGFESYIEESAKDFLFFKTNHLLEKTKNDPIKRSGLIKDVVSTLAKIPDPIKRALYIRQRSKLLDVNEAIIVNATNKEKSHDFKKYVDKKEQQQIQIDQSIPDRYDEETASAGPKGSNPDDSLEMLEEKLIQILFNFGHLTLKNGAYVAPYIIKQLKQSDIVFKKELFQRVIDIYIKKLGEGEIPDADFFQNETGKKVSGLYAHLTFDKYELSANWETKHQIFVTTIAQNFEVEVINLVNRFKLKHLMMMVKENQDRMKTERDEGELRRILKVHQRLLGMQMELAKLLNIVVVK